MARTKVVYNAVDLRRFAAVRLTRAEARSRLGLGERDGPILAVVAQITPWKGQDDAIEIARRLLPRHPGLKLLLVGSPKFDSAATRYDNLAFLESLRREASVSEADFVRFLGERDDVPEILRAVDLLLAPSWEEPFGRAVVEAMASGVPVVATDVGGPPEIIAETKGGLILPPRRPDAWAKAISALLDDGPRREAMAEDGRGSARARFGADQHAQEILRIYDATKAATS
jgi:glycosyltransferase involved in cell wall biosynthesis